MKEKFITIKLFKYYLFASFSKKGFGWFRLFGKGIKWKDITKNQLLFSERYGYSKGITIGKWRISLLE